MGSTGGRWGISFVIGRIIMGPSPVAPVFDDATASSPASGSESSSLAIRVRQPLLSVRLLPLVWRRSSTVPVEWVCSKLDTEDERTGSTAFVVAESVRLMSLSSDDVCLRRRISGAPSRSACG